MRVGGTMDSEATPIVESHMEYLKALHTRSWEMTSRTGMLLSVTCDFDSATFRDFFTEYEKAFVLPAEREEESGFKDCLALNHGHLHDGLEAQFGRFVEIVLTARTPDTAAMVGGINLIAMQYEVLGSPIVTSNLNYIFTTPEGRGRGYFPRLIDAAAEVVEQLFGLPEGGEPPLIFVEQNDPFKMSAEDYAADTAHAGIDQFARLLKWAKAGARVLDFDYVQPALSPDQHPDQSLVYTVLNAPSDTLDAEIVSAHLERFFAISVAKGRPAPDSQTAQTQLSHLAGRAARGLPVIVQNPLPFLLDRSQAHRPVDGNFPNSLSSALPRILTGYSKTVEPSLHWTLSLHIDNEELGRLGKANGANGNKTLFDQLGGTSLSEQPTKNSIWNADKRLQRQRENQQRFPTSAELRDAMEPMFNDVADRERLGIVEDYMLAIAAKTDNPSATDREIVTFTLDPAKIAWETEGTKYRAELAELPPQQVEMRRFWYVHRNCSVSYHVSFRIVGYERTPAFFFFVSMLQKLVSPKEFLLPDTQEAQDLIADAHPALTPFEAIRVVSHRGDLDFWQFMAGLFDRDFGDFSTRLGQKPPANTGVSPWRTLNQEPYVEVPGLKMPNLRSMFYFADSVFRDLLLPRDDDGAPTKRLKMLSEAFFNDKLAEVLDQANPEHGTSGRRNPIPKSVTFGLPFWDWLSRAHFDAIALEWRQANPVAFASLQKRTAYGDSGGSIALCYLFLAGFTQNIIDFVNQDASEVLDSLDPLYPSTEDDLDEGFFVRYANPRTLFTFVSRMRSLDLGADYIGTCPYAFLIHVLTLHNEFLTRDFEKNAATVLNEAEEKAGDEDFSGAANCFYDFRRTYVSEYDTYKYENVFRYDTEAKIFFALNKIRGVELKHAYVEQLINAAEKRTANYEERQKRDADASLAKNLAVVALFSVIGVALQLSSDLKSDEPILDVRVVADALFCVSVIFAVFCIAVVYKFMFEQLGLKSEPLTRITAWYRRKK